MPKNVQTTTQLNSCHMLPKWCSKFSKSEFNSTWTMNFQMFKLDLEKAEDLESKLPTSIWASLVAQRLKHLPPMQKTQVWSLGWEDPLEKEMATHSSILAWRIPWTEKPGRLQSTGPQSRTWLSDFTFPFIGSSKKQKSSRETSAYVLLTVSKPLTVWITANCGKFLKRREYRTTWPAPWEICMQVRKQQIELGMEQQTGFKSEKEYVKAAYCHPAY